MKLWVLKKECMMILILDTNGVLPTKMQRDLMLCRSLTLPADYLLMGPVQLGKCPIFWCIEPEGKRISGDMQAAAAFCACLGRCRIWCGFDSVRRVPELFSTAV